MDGLLKSWQTFKYEVCFHLCVCDVCCTREVHCQLVNVYGVCVIPLWDTARLLEITTSVLQQ